MSTPSIIPFFGRAYSLTITPNQGPSAGTPIVVSSDSFQPNALRFSFEVTQYAWSEFWHAEITIYNADGPITDGPSAGVNLYKAIINEGDKVILCAGYQADYPDAAAIPSIFEGPIFYTIQDRVDVVDKRLILHCILTRVLTVQNFINDTLPALSTRFSQAQMIAQKSITPIGINGSAVQSALDTAQRTTPITYGADKLPRGKSYFGNPHHYLRAIADQGNLLSWFDKTNWNVQSLVENELGPLAATYGPVNPMGGPPATVGGVTLSLIGQPQQTQLGVNFRVLLDPNVQVRMPLPQVAIQLEFVRQAPIAYPIPQGQIAPVPLVDNYVVVGVRFSGDTRGNAWYSDITGLSQIKDVVLLLGQNALADPGNNG